MRVTKIQQQEHQRRKRRARDHKGLCSKQFPGVSVAGEVAIFKQMPLIHMPWSLGDMMIATVTLLTSFLHRGRRKVDTMRAPGKIRKDYGRQAG